MAESYEVDIEEVEYLRHGDQPLLARVFKPRGKGPFPAVVEAHGGAWVEGNRANNDAINMPVAKGGVVVAALDFRCPPVATYPASVADVNYGVRWLKANAARFNTRAEWVGTMGTSSGGHLAVLAALKPNDPRYAAIASPGGFDARVPYVVTLWPVICPIGRFRDRKERDARGEQQAQRAGRPAGGAGPMQQKYWLTEEAMAEGSPNLALQRGDKVELPNVLYLQNPIDTLHPRANLESFVAGYRKAGGQLQLEFFEGKEYDLVRSNPSSESARGAVRKIIEFIQRQAAARRAKAA
jgi:acetyl esterase